MEWIKYHEAEKVFDLRTEHSTYQMQVREYDTLVHLYYGSPVGDALITDRIVCVDRGFSGNPYEAEKDKTFSLDTLPQEYTTYGNGDYRINGLETEQADGSDTANLKFESYEITKGKYSLRGLPAMFAKEDEAETLEIVLTDRASGLKAHLLYGVFPHLLWKWTMNTENWMQFTSMADTIWNARWREHILVMATGLWEVSVALPAIITIHL